MSQEPINVIDSEDDDIGDDQEDAILINLDTPILNPPKKPRIESSNFVDLDSDGDSPMMSSVPITPRSTLKPSGDGWLISDGSDIEAGLKGETCLKNVRAYAGSDVGSDLGRRPEYSVKENKESACDVDLDSWLNIESDAILYTGVQRNGHVEGGDVGKFTNLTSTNTYDRFDLVDDTDRIQPVEIRDDCDHEKANVRLDTVDATNNGDTINAEKREKKVKHATDKKKAMEEKLHQKELEKERKAKLKAEAAELKQIEKEKKKSEKYKFTEKDIVAVIDSNVLPGSLGGPLLTLFNQKHRSPDIESNPIRKSIVWRMKPPKEISQLAPGKIDIQYIFLIYDDAEEFCNQANDGSLIANISSVRKRYPSYTICCLTNRLMSFINKREQQMYKNPKAAIDWQRPPVEELFAKLTTQFAHVHLRQCADEAEVAEHVVGLTISLGKCHSRPKLTHLSVNANKCNNPKNSVDRELIMKNPWLKALVSIPKVQTKYAIAIWKKYPTMKSLLRVYMDSTKTVSFSIPCSICYIFQGWFVSSFLNCDIISCQFCKLSTFESLGLKILTSTPIICTSYNILQMVDFTLLFMEMNHLSYFNDSSDLRYAPL